MTDYPLLGGLSQEATQLLALTALQSLLADSPDLATVVPDGYVSAPPTRVVGEQVWNCSFSEVGASVLASQFRTPVAGTGVGYSQASGALAVTSGTTTNAEFFTRSTQSFRGSMMLTFSTVLSQRIANNNFAVILADLFGDSLPVTINSATSITVTKVAHGLTAQNVGQFMFIGGIAGAAGVPGRYAIASIPSVDTVNFTVASWPASGSCTATIFGHNHVKHIFTGTTATAMSVNNQRRGWADTDTTATINTTASPGLIAKTTIRPRSVDYMDMLRASATAPIVNSRASRLENLPDDSVDMYLFLWSYNGTTAPASTTTWTISFCAIEKFAPLPVFDEGSQPQHQAFAKSVQVINSLTAAISSIAAGANLIGDVSVNYRAGSAGGATPSSILSPATNVGASIKAGAGRVVGIVLTNTATAVRSFKLYNATSVTMGTTAAVFEIDIPANGMVQIAPAGGIAFATGIMWATTAGKGLTDNTSGVAANDVSGVVLYV